MSSLIMDHHILITLNTLGLLVHQFFFIVQYGTLISLGLGPHHDLSPLRFPYQNQIQSNQVAYVGQINYSFQLSQHDLDRNQIQGNF